MVTRTELPDGCYHLRYDDGTETWHNSQGLWHRFDGPAYCCEEVEIYSQHGRLHRLDGPAVIRHDGIQYWVDGLIPKTILDIVITNRGFDFDSFPSAIKIENYFNASGQSAYRITDSDELVLAILRYG